MKRVKTDNNDRQKQRRQLTNYTEQPSLADELLHDVQKIYWRHIQAKMTKIWWFQLSKWVFFLCLTTHKNTKKGNIFSF